MTDLKKAAQQALEALKCLVETYEMGNTIRADIMDAEEAITAIKTALEQPEQPEQEPVARVLQTVGQYYTGRFVAEVETVRRMRNGESLYTHQPRREWRSLSEEEIHAALPHEPGDLDFVCARSVEQALKEKNT
jgi:hypothetical protein